MTEQTTTRDLSGEMRTHNYGFGLEVFVDESGAVVEVGHWGNGSEHISCLWSHPVEAIMGIDRLREPSQHER